MDSKYRKYLQSKEWLETRLDILTTRKKCERCGSKHQLQVHHKTYKNIFNEEPDDLELLCAKCHQNEHNLLKPKKKKLSSKEKKKELRLKLKQKVKKEQRRKEQNYRKFEGREGFT